MSFNGIRENKLSPKFPNLQYDAAYRLSVLHQIKEPQWYTQLPIHISTLCLPVIDLSRMTDSDLDLPLVETSFQSVLAVLLSTSLQFPGKGKELILYSLESDKPAENLQLHAVKSDNCIILDLLDNKILVIMA